MSNARPILRLAWLALIACAQPLDLPAPPAPVASEAPVLTIDEAAPLLAKVGDTLKLRFHADRPLVTCAGALEKGDEAAEARCESPADGSCACTVFVDGSVSDGSARLVARGTALSGTSESSRTIQLDTVPPAVELSRVVIERKPVGTNDRVAGTAGAVTDPGTSYPERRATKIELFVNDDLAPAVVANVAADGSFGPVDLPGSEATTSDTTAPRRVRAIAHDAAGNTSPSPVELTRGADLAGPSVDGARVSFRRRDTSAADTVVGTAGALTDDASVVTMVRLYDAAEGGALVATARVAGDGSFQELAVGDHASAYAELWASGLDKCGHEGARVAVEGARALDAPQVDGPSVTFERRPMGSVDALVLPASSITSVCAPTLVRAWSDAKRSSLLGAASPDSSGTATVAIGTPTLAPARAFVTVQDKCGLETATAVEATGSGRAIEAPAIDGARVAFRRRDVGQLDGIVGSAGAVRSTCGLDSISVLRSADALTPEASGPASSDGGFPELPVGEPAQSHARAWIVATDKCGHSSVATEAMDGAALSGPVAHADRVRFVRHGAGEPDGVIADGDAFEGTCAIDSFTIASSDTSMRIARSGAVRGGFAEQAIGTSTRAPARVVVAATDKCGLTGPALELVETITVASLDASRLAFVRRDLSAPDGVQALPGAIQAGRCAPVRIEWLSHGDQGVIAVVAAKADGSTDEVTIGTSSSAPARLLARVEDKCGGISNVAEVSRLAGVSAPSVDASRVAFTRRPLGLVDGLSGAAGALSSGACKLARVVATDAASNGAVLGSQSVGADAGFPEFAIGREDASTREAWISAVDKCGLASHPVLAPNADRTAPSLDAAQLVFVSGEPPSVLGQAGCVSDASSAVAQIDLCSTVDCSRSNSHAHLVPGVDGGFTTTGLPMGASQVWAIASDKAGNVSAPVASATLRRLLTLDGRVPYDDTSSANAAFAFAADRDPRTAGPGLALAIAPEAADPGFAVLEDSRRIRSMAVSEDASEPLAWTNLSARRRGEGALVISAGRPPLAIAPGPDTLELSEWDGVRWVDVPAANAPSARSAFAAAVDASHGIALIYGGSGTSETWSLDLSTRTWTLLTPTIAGSMPLRERCAMAYDDARRVFVLTGAATSNPGSALDTWEFDPSAGATGTWRRSPSTGPAPRLDHAMAYDVARARVMLFGGTLIAENPSRPSCELWSFDGTTWTRESDETCVNGPRARTGHALAYDMARSQLVLFGGWSREKLGTAYLDGIANDLWVRRAGVWSELTTAQAPPARQGALAAIDVANGRFVVFGGRGAGDRALGDTWQFDLATKHWSALDASPAARTGAGFAFDTRRGAGVLVGGASYDATSFEPFDWFASTSLWSGSGWTSALPPVPWALGYRSGQGVVYDAWNGRVLAVGGNRSLTLSAATTPDTRTADVWALGEQGWSLVSNGGNMPARSEPAVAFDSARGRLVIFGGTGASGILGDTWELDVRTGAIAQVAQNGPSARSLAAMAYDPVRNVTVLFGGSSTALGTAPLADTWEWNGSTWRAITPSAPAPEGRAGAALAFDPVGARLVLTGGATPIPANDAWSFDGSWSALAAAGAPTPVWGHAMTFDPALGRLVTFGGLSSGPGFGLSNSTPSGETWALGERSAHARWAGQLFAFHPTSGNVRSITVHYTGAGTGAAGPGVELLAWNHQTGRWSALGSLFGSDSAPASLRTLDATVTTSAPAFVGSAGRIWLLAAARSGSGRDASSSVSTDVLTVRVDEAR